MTRVDMVNMSKRQPHGDEKCRLKATHWSSLNDEELLHYVRLQYGLDLLPTNSKNQQDVALYIMLKISPLKHLW